MSRQLVIMFLDRDSRSITMMAGLDAMNIYNCIDQNLTPGMVPTDNTPPELTEALPRLNEALASLWRNTTDEQHRAFIADEDVQAIGAVWDSFDKEVRGQPVALRSQQEVLRWQKDVGIRYPKPVPGVY